MKICAVQAHSLSGDIEHNSEHHCRLVESAAGRGADVIVFPELSLTGYEPTMAADLTLDRRDPRLAPLQQLADRHKATVIAGAPTAEGRGVCISALILRPDAPPGIYSKRYLHADEWPYFAPGSGSPVIECGDTRVALAICYELSKREHAAAALAGDAQVYIASVVKFDGDMEAAHARLAQIASEYRVPVIMSNAVGIADGQRCAGASAAWDSDGKKLAELDGEHEGILIFDSISRRVEIARI